AETRASVEAVVDTGFNGFLTLRPSIITRLALQWLYRDEGTLADGSVELFDVYAGTILWHGVARTIEIDAVNAESLIGMRLLRQNDVHFEVIEGGKVLIKPRESTAG